MLYIRTDDDYPQCSVLSPVGELDAFTVTLFREAIAGSPLLGGSSSTSRRCHSSTRPAWAP